MVSSGTGAPVYRIVYISNGQSNEVLYDANGAIVKPPLAPSERIDDRPGFPSPVIAPGANIAQPINP